MLVRRALTTGVLIIGVLASLAGVPAQEAGQNPDSERRGASGTLDVGVVDGLVHVAARNAPLGALLEEIVEQTNLVIVSRVPLDRPVTLAFEGLSLPEAVKRILWHEGFVLHQASSSPGAARDQSARPSTLWIFPGDWSGGAADRTVTLRKPKHESPGAAEVAELEQMLLSDDLRIRRRAIKELRRVNPESGLAGLAQALSDPDERVRIKAVYGLADSGGEQAAAALTAALADSSALVRQEAVYALSVAGGETARRVLPQALRDTNPDVREAAIDAYEDLGGDTAVAGLAVALQDREASLRVEAVEALRDIGNESAVQALQNALSDGHKRVRTAAVTALGEIGGDSAVRALTLALDDQDPAVRARAVNALGTTESESARQALVRVAVADEETSVRKAAEAALRGQ